MERKISKIIEFLKFGDQNQKSAEGIRRTLEVIKTIKPKLKGTTLEDEIDRFEERLLSDPLLLEK